MFICCRSSVSINQTFPIKSARQPGPQSQQRRNGCVIFSGTNFRIILVSSRFGIAVIHAVKNAKLLYRETLPSAKTKRSEKTNKIRRSRVFCGSEPPAVAGG